MKRVVPAALVCAIALCLAWTSSTARKPNSVKLLASLCQPTEQAIFQCVLKTKQVAVCAADRPNQNVVQYRFGRPGKIELAYPVDPKNGPGSLKWATTGFSGGGGMQIHFENAGTRYVLYSNMVRTGFGSDGLNYPMDQLGLFATRNGQLTYDQHCKSDSSLAGGNDGWINEAKAKSSLPEGEYLYGPDAFYKRWEKEVHARR